MMLFLQPSSIPDLYDDHTSPASAAQGLLYKAARKRKEVSLNAYRSTCFGVYATLFFPG